MRASHLCTGLALAAVVSYQALAVEYPIGAPQQRHGMEIAGVYLQPVEMESVMGHQMLPASKADVHLEADSMPWAATQMASPRGIGFPI